MTHTHTNTHTVGLLWTGDRPVAKTSIWQNAPITRERLSRSRRDSNSQSLRLRPRRLLRSTVQKCYWGWV